VVLGLARQGVRQFTIANRTVERAQELTRRLEGVAADLRFAVVALDALEPNHVAQADIVVNATSLGMVGALKVPDVLVDNIRRDHVVCDVVYGQRPTKPLEQARLLGARVVDGLGMLTWQAALAFELWTGRRAPLEVMRSAAR
jgi:shikimate dehydrogenase